MKLHSKPGRTGRVDFAGVWQLDFDYLNGSLIDLSTGLNASLSIHESPADYSSGMMDAVADYSHTGKIDSIVANYNGVVLPNFTLDGQAGGVYGGTPSVAAAPEPANWLLIAAGVLFLVIRCRHPATYNW